MCQLCNSSTICKFKIQVVHNEVEHFFTKMELLDFKVNLALTKLEMVESRLVTNGFIFSDDISDYIHLVVCYCYLKILKVLIIIVTCKIHSNSHKIISFSYICATLILKLVIFFSSVTCFVSFKVNFLINFFFIVKICLLQEFIKINFSCYIPFF